MKPIIGIAALLLVNVLGSAAYAQTTPPTAVRPPGPFADVPLTDPAFHNIDVMQKAGIVIGYYDTGTYGGRREVTRYEFAGFIARLLPALLYASSNNKDNPTLSQAHSDLDAKLMQHPETITAFDALLTEFQPYVNELRDIDVKNVTPKGQAVAMAQARLAVLKGNVQTQSTVTRDTPFPDVPKDHWAYQAVETLRTTRIMRGYPTATPSAK